MTFEKWQDSFACSDAHSARDAWDYQASRISRLVDDLAVHVGYWEVYREHYAVGDEANLVSKIIADLKDTIRRGEE